MKTNRILFGSTILAALLAATLLFDTYSVGQTKKKIGTDYTEETTPAANDYFHMVKSGGGAGTDRNVKFTNVPKSFLSAITSGYLLYANASNTFSGGPFWDATNARLGINTATPNRDLVLYGPSAPVMTFNNTTTGVAAGDGAALYINGSDFYLENQEAAGTNIIKATTSTQIPLTVTMAAGQSATPFVIKNNSGAAIVSSGADGGWTFGADLYSNMSSSQSTWYHRNSGDTKFYLQTNSTSGHTRIDSDHKILIAPNNTTYAEFSTTGHLILGSGAASSEFRLLEPSGSGTNYNAFKTAAQAGNVTYTLPTADGTNGYQLTTNGSGTLSWEAAGSGGGGLTKFTEAESTSSPNDIVYVDSLTAAGAATNVDVAIVPKGTGALLVAIPNSGTAGGNKRGARAVDLQLTRAIANQVASGNQAVILGGASNKASGDYSIAAGGGSVASNSYAIALGSGNTASHSYTTVSGGYLNTASAQYATVSGGSLNNGSAQYTTISGGGYNAASGTYSSISGGSTNAASADYATVGGGSSNTASGNSSTVIGGQTNTASGSYSIASGKNAVASLYGEHTQANGRFSTDGDAQTSVLTARAATTNANDAELYLDGVGASNRLVLPANTSWGANITIVARSSSDHAMWKHSCLINRNGSSSTTIPGSVSSTPVAVDYSSGASSWTVTITADDTNESLKIRVNGAFVTSIKWVARIELTEVSG